MFSPMLRCSTGRHRAAQQGNSNSNSNSNSLDSESLVFKNKSYLCRDVWYFHIRNHALPLEVCFWCLLDKRIFLPGAKGSERSEVEHLTSYSANSDECSWKGAHCGASFQRYSHRKTQSSMKDTTTMIYQKSSISTHKSTQQRNRNSSGNLWNNTGYKRYKSIIIRLFVSCGDPLPKQTSEML